MSLPEQVNSRPRVSTMTRLSKLQELVTCAVCMEFLKNPKVFPCLHTFCYECIVTLREQRKGDLKCPECRSHVEIGNPPDLTKLPTNFFANNVLAILSLTGNDKAPDLLCDNCEDADSPVEKRCQTCLSFLCAPCAESHQRSRDTKDHVFLLKAELKDSEPSEYARPVKCSEHNELVKFYCDLCKKTTCMSCTVLDHKDHKQLSLEESASKAKEEMKELVEKVEERVEAISTGIKRAETKCQDITEREEACKSQIETFFALLHKEIDAEKLNILTSFTRATELQKEKVETSKKVLELALSTCENGVNFARNTLRNSNDVQLLDTKPTITSYLGNLKNVQDDIPLHEGNPIRFLKKGSIRQLCQEITAGVCSVEEVIVCAKKCEAKLTNPIVKVGKKSLIMITCKDKDGRVISSGCGNDQIEPIFTNLTVKDIELSEKQDGTHEISFVPTELGTLQFAAKINGCTATGCSLTEDVKWELSDAYGSGYLQFNREIVDSMSGEGDVGQYCFRLGDTPMTSGIHHWTVEISHVVQDSAECLLDSPTFEVGVIDASVSNSTKSMEEKWTKKWVYEGPAKKITTVVLNVDMEGKSLIVIPSGRTWGATFRPSLRQKTFCNIANAVLPFFSVNCPHCRLTLMS